MSILAVSAGVVTAVRGEAFVRSPQGELVAVKVGDSLQAGQPILGPNGEVLESAPDPAARPTAVATDVDQAIEALNAPATEEDAPAAGLTVGGPNASLGEGLRVDRVVEAVSPQAFEQSFNLPPDRIEPLPGGLSDQRALNNPDVTPPTTPVVKPFLVVYSEDTVEGQFAQFTVNLTQASPGPVTVKLDLLPGSDPTNAAQPGVDTTGNLELFNTVTQQWEAVTGDLTFAAGQTEIQVRVATVDDTEVEGIEFIQLQATVISGETANTVASNDLAITDNDKPFLVVYSQDTVEGQLAEFTVNLTQASPGPVTVKLDLLPGSDPTNAAQPGVDTTGNLEFLNTDTQQWEAVTGDLTFAAGQTAIQVRVATVDDAFVEGVEFIQLQATVISGETQNTVASNDLAITDNDKPFLVVYSQDTVEGQLAEFTVNLTQASPGPVTVKLDLLPGSDPTNAAQPGVDTSGNLEFFNTVTQQWEAVTADLTFAAGQTAIQVRVATVDDAFVEGVEFIQLQATVISGETQNTVASNDLAITDNDKPFLVVYSQDTVEGQLAEFTVNLTQASPGPVTVKLDLLPGSDPTNAAQPGVDTTGNLEFFNTVTQQWEAVTGDLTFAAGQTAIQVRVATVDDVEIEGVEFIQLQATVISGETQNTVASNDLAITDNDKPFLVVYSQDTVEGQLAEFTVNLTQASPNPVTVKLDLLPGSDPTNAAQPGVDTTGNLEFFNPVTQQWEAVTGDLTFAAGQTAIQVRVATVDDAEIEGVEFIQLQATVISGETANTVASNDLAITDNDKPYMVVYSNDAIEGEYVHYTVNLTSPVSEVVAVTLALQAGGTPADAAQPGIDSSTNLEFFNNGSQQWESVTGPLSFQPGEIQIQLRVASVDDAEVEPVEYLRLHATVIQGEVINPITWNDAAITDNEGRTIMGTQRDDEILGQAGPDVLNGRAGDDLLIGGQGDDILIGGGGADVFAWRLGDVVDGKTTVDRIEDFDLLPHAAGGDVLDLRDLLQGEYVDGGTGNLTQYLHFDTSGTDTRIQISLTGDLNNGHGTITQEIVLEGVNLRTGFGLDAGAGDGAIIARMLADQKLWVDE